jgi:hypothetical protein
VLPSVWMHMHMRLCVGMDVRGLSLGRKHMLMLVNVAAPQAQRDQCPLCRCFARHAHAHHRHPERSTHQKSITIDTEREREKDRHTHIHNMAALRRCALMKTMDGRL